MAKSVKSNKTRKSAPTRRTKSRARPKKSVQLASPDRPGHAISFAELVEKVQTGKITGTEIKKYFIADEVGDKPFAPKILVDERIVDIAGVESLARASANALAQDASRAVREATEAVKSMRFGVAAGKRILAEGDSWFNLPDFLFPKTLADIVGNTRRVRNIAKWGDELSDMIAIGEYLRPIENGQVSALMFSGGGNDVLGGGRLYRLLRVRRSGDHDPRNAPRYLRPRFYRNLNIVARQIRTLSNQVRRRDPHVKIFLHGYDYAVPRINGHWLGRSLERQGFHPHYEKRLARAIIKVMIDAHNAQLSSLQSQLPNLVHVDLRGNVSERQWHDELHAKTTGARKLAKAYDRALSNNGIGVATS